MLTRRYQSLTTTLKRWPDAQILSEHFKMMHEPSVGDATCATPCIPQHRDLRVITYYFMVAICWILVWGTPPPHSMRPPPGTGWGVWSIWSNDCTDGCYSAASKLQWHSSVDILSGRKRASPAFLNMTVLDLVHICPNMPEVVQSLSKNHFPR